MGGSVMNRINLVAAIILVLATFVIAAEEGGWKKAMSLGATLTSGNSETLTLNGGVGVEKKIDKHELSIGAEANYSESEVEKVVAGQTNRIDETTADNSKAYLKYKRKFGRPFFYSDNGLFRDEPGAIEQRVTVGLGCGFFVLKTDAATLGLEVGGSWIDEEFTTEQDGEDYFALRFAARHDHELSETAKLWASVEYLQRSDESEKYFLTSEAGIEAVMNSSLSLRLVLQARYDSLPPDGIEKDDLSLVSAFVCKL